MIPILLALPVFWMLVAACLAWLAHWPAWIVPIVGVLAFGVTALTLGLCRESGNQ